MLEINCDYMILRGCMAVGKTTTGRALFKYLHKQEVIRSFIPFDVLRKLLSKREPTYKLKKLHTKNTVILANNFISEGYFTIIEGVYAIQDLLENLKVNINGDYKLFTLICDRETLLKRDKAEERKFSCGSKNIDFALNLFKKYSSQNSEEILINNTNLSINDVVEKIIYHIKK